METDFLGWVAVRPDGPAELQRVERKRLPAEDVQIRVHYTSLNYKDALALTGKGKVVRQFPMVPGIDLAGEVVKSWVPEFAPGDRVLATGYGLGEHHWGGFAELAALRREWLIRLPGSMSLIDSMRLGTAGFTAMLCVMALEEAGITPGRGDIAVTGAGGGVGGLAILLLSLLGYRATAITRRPELNDYFLSLGAAAVIGQEALGDPLKPLQSERWAGVIDTVGGEQLALLLSQTAYEGCVAACGLAGGASMTTTVLPFILRGVRLVGIDSVRCDLERRMRAWQRLAELIAPERLAAMTTTLPLEQALDFSDKLLKGEVRGRCVIRLAGEAGEG